MLPDDLLMCMRASAYPRAKQANILVGQNGEIKITDFGTSHASLARLEPRHRL